MDIDSNHPFDISEDNRKAQNSKPKKANKEVRYVLLPM